MIDDEFIDITWVIPVVFSTYIQVGRSYIMKLTGWEIAGAAGFIPGICTFTDLIKVYIYQKEGKASF